MALSAELRGTVVERKRKETLEMIGKVIITSSNPPCRACGGMDGYHYTSCSLVAASPDLLEACKHMLDYCPAGLMQSLEAAIRKAEGRPADAPAAP